MKIAGVISTEEARFGPVLYKGNIYENVKKLGKLGYDGVEITIRDPKEIDKSNLKKVLKKYSLCLSALGTGQAVSGEGISFTNPNQKIREAAIERIKEHIKLASEFNSYVIIGLIKGNLPNNSQVAQAKEWAIEGCCECADYAQENHVIVLIETINRYEANWINSISDGIEIINTINKNNMFLHIDTFHMNIEDASFRNSILYAKNKIGYIHFADSNRWVPGYGHINFQEIVSTLKEINYQGFLSLECLPFPTPDIAAKKGINHLQKMLSI